MSRAASGQARSGWMDGTLRRGRRRLRARHRLHHRPDHRRRPRRLPGRARPLPPGRGPGLPVGQPVDHRAPPARPRAGAVDGHRRADPRRAQLDVRPRPGRARPGARHRAPAGGVPSPASPTTTGASPCRRSSTSRPAQVVTNDFPQITLDLSTEWARPPPRRRARPVPARHRRDEIDEVMELVYRDVNNGVYRCGFAGSQEAYERGLRPAVRPARLAVRAARRASATSSATRSPRPTSGCSPPWSASTPSTTATSSATATS